MTEKIGQDGRAVIIGAGAVLASLTSVTLGAAIAKTLFPLVGAYGITSLRVGLGAILLLLFRRPWRRAVPSALLRPLIAYGAVLGLMNILIYQAFARIPIGIAIAIEVIGPLAVVLFGSRRPRDFLWLAAAVGGLLLLLPVRSDAALDPLGVGFALAAAACWATYILTGKRVSGALGGDAVAWGMVIAAILILPVGVAHQTAALFSPHVLLLGMAIAFLSSALPYSLDMEAMRRLPAPVFGLMVSSAPAVGAVIGFVLLDERLTQLQWIAVLCIMAASGGSALTVGHKPAIEDAPQ
ncbi:MULTISPECIES: EamA family transporter [Sphingobium]|jgi:inner membrane transporter RhtA|uniref:EamA family transporter n=1 Tax=Sphingobium TaxID=165695 RepID=UPI000E71D999|nr:MULTISPECIES: EamA family transporter [Sphingobium]KAA9016554.1 EamA family transporter [Sphingobium limneticum]MBU0931561.1 EamA family transporter [Alphaproteobacteria bacterium]